MEEKKKPIKKIQEPLESLKLKLEIWESEGIPCSYIRFHQPIPPHENAEPVSEFKMTQSVSKYRVDSIRYTEHGVIWRSRNEVNICALANVMYSRSCLK